MKRTKEEAAETARVVLSTAEKLFLEKGFDDVSLEEIATVAGVTRGAVHWHFKNKQGLLLALRETAQDSIQQLADELTKNDGGASLDQLEAFFSKLFKQLEYQSRQQSLMRCMLRLDMAMAEHDDLDKCASFHRNMHDIIHRIFHAVERDSGLPAPWTAEKCAMTFSITVSGLLTEWSLGRIPFQLSCDGMLLVRTLLSNWKIEGSQAPADLQH